MSVKARPRAGLALAAALLLSGAGGASAQGADCDADYAACAAACAAACQGEGAESCRAECPERAGCVYQRRLCRNRAQSEQGGAAPERSAPPSMRSLRLEAPADAPAAVGAESAPMAPAAEAAAPAAATPRAAARTMSLEAPLPGGELEAKIYFLRRTDAEPANALFYGYLIIGPNVSQERKLAVIKGLACRLEVADAAAAAAIERLGLVSIPAQHEAAGVVTNPAEMLSAYDFPRADTWLRAAGFAMDADFAPDQAVLFVGSRSARARQMDAVALPGPGDQLDPIVADASGLSPRYLERWTMEVVKGVRSGSIRSRQSMQSVMEAHSWLEVVGSPLAALMRIGPAAASEGPPPWSCL